MEQFGMKSTTVELFSTLTKFMIMNINHM